MEPYEGLEIEFIEFEDTDIIVCSGAHEDTEWIKPLQIPGIPDPNQIYNPDSF